MTTVNSLFLFIIYLFILCFNLLCCFPLMLKLKRMKVSSAAIQTVTFLTGCQQGFKLYRMWESRK